jgi:hypothetical protein
MGKREPKEPVPKIITFYFKFDLYLVFSSPDPKASHFSVD